MYYVSPDQVNFLVPANLLPGASTVQVVLDGHSGPAVKITLASASPALFQLDAKTAVAIRPDGSVITRQAPAKPGEIILLYATGLGQTLPPVPYGQLFNDAAPLQQFANFELVLDGVTAGPGAVQYAGIAPGFAGLYQINVLLPKSTKANPEIRIGFGKQLSIERRIHLTVRFGKLPFLEVLPNATVRGRWFFTILLSAYKNLSGTAHRRTSRYRFAGAPSNPNSFNQPTHLRSTSRCRTGSGGLCPTTG